MSAVSAVSPEEAAAVAEAALALAGYEVAQFVREVCG